MKEKWIYAVRKIIKDTKIDDSKFDDDEVLEILKGVTAPTFCKKFNIDTEFSYNLFFYSMIQIAEPPKEFTKEMKMNIDEVKSKLNKN